MIEEGVRGRGGGQKRGGGGGGKKSGGEEMVGEGRGQGRTLGAAGAVPHPQQVYPSQPHLL